MGHRELGDRRRVEAPVRHESWRTGLDSEQRATISVNTAHGRIIVAVQVRLCADVPTESGEMDMKRMTVLFEDEELYTAVKVEAARRNRPLKDLVTQALRKCLEAQEDAELLPTIDAARAEWKERSGIASGSSFVS